jgi:hypothetical protein
MSPFISPVVPSGAPAEQDFRDLGYSFGQRNRLPPAFTLVSCLTYSSTLKMAATCSSETSVDFQLTIRRYSLRRLGILYMGYPKWSTDTLSRKYSGHCWCWWRERQLLTKFRQSGTKGIFPYTHVPCALQVGFLRNSKELSHYSN